MKRSLLAAAVIMATVSATPAHALIQKVMVITVLGRCPLVITARIIGIIIIHILAITVRIFGTVGHIMVIIIALMAITTIGHIITAPGVITIMAGSRAH